MFKCGKFDINNYRQGKFKIKCAMTANGIDIFIPKSENNQSEWLKHVAMAMFILTSAMELKQILH